MPPRRCRPASGCGCVRGCSGSTAADGWHEVRTDSGTLRCRWLVNAAGLESDLIDAMLGGGSFTIQPRRGELIVFDKLARPLVGSILLPVPTPQTKGVLVAPTVYGNVLLGPTAQDVPTAPTRRPPPAGLSSLLAAGGRSCPSWSVEEVTATYAGLRAATEHRDYQIRVDAGRRYACVGGIRSTGLTASLGHRRVRRRAPRGRRTDTAGTRRRPASAAADAVHRPGRAAAVSGRRTRIAADAAYGDIVCHCERVTRGEIRDALRQPAAACRPRRTAAAHPGHERPLPGVLLRRAVTSLARPG